ncbi:MAG: hypothetical protein Fur0021_13500 [Candidatus Promineifilaceae bacterium]
MPTQRIFPYPHVLFRELADESVLLDLKTGQYYGLDSVGTRVWQLLSLHHDLAELGEALLAEYDVDPAVLERDLPELAAQLARANLVVLSVEDESP